MMRLLWTTDPVVLVGVAFLAGMVTSRLLARRLGPWLRPSEFSNPVAGGLSVESPVGLTAHGGRSVGNVGATGVQGSGAASGQTDADSPVHALSLRSPCGGAAVVHGASGPAHDERGAP